MVGTFGTREVKVGLLLEVLEQAMDWEGEPGDLDEAGLVVFLLVERTRYGSTCEGLIAEPFLSYFPDEAEVDEAVTRIITHAESIEMPNVRLVQALARCRDRRAVPVLQEILERVWDDPNQEALASNCVRGIAFNAWGENPDMLRRAAGSIWPSVRQFASDSLRQLARTAEPNTEPS
ncbi:MAG: hypothetical protein JNL79_13005 [Myxococcales bacterium]|nr:hypothetical protein [Myxococcales bacterium]